MEFKCAVFPVLMLSMLSAWTNGYYGAGHAAQYASHTTRKARSGVERTLIEKSVLSTYVFEFILSLQ